MEPASPKVRQVKRATSRRLLGLTKPAGTLHRPTLCKMSRSLPCFFSQSSPYIMSKPLSCLYSQPLPCLFSQSFPL
jgi:hypothetical protein